MIFIKYNFENENIVKIPHEEILFYDNNNIIRCPNCNNIIFFIVNYYYHKCPNKEKESFEINKNIIKNQKNKFLCNKIYEIGNKCLKHNCEFLYYKKSNYYCSKCLIEKKIKNFLILDEIVLSEEEINNFTKLIKECENILLNSKEKLNYNDIKTNKILIEYCKNLLFFYEKFEKNYNLITTIRRISINTDLNKSNNNNYIIKFNCEYDDYFNSENILQNGKYYIGKTINKGSFGEVKKALSIKDKKLVAIKKLSDKEDYSYEIEILKVMNECEFSVKYIDSFEEKNHIFIVTELCDSNLRNEILLQKNGFSIENIKKIFSQINEGLNFLINIKKIIHRDLKPDNILINKIKKKDNSFYYKYKLCDYGFAKYLEGSYLESKVGTGIYEAPEIKYYKYTYLSDVFSLGIILYELYYGILKISQENLLNNIKMGLKIKNENNNVYDFYYLNNLITECTKEEKNIIKWNDYFNHPFFYYEIKIIITINENDLNKNIKLIGFNIFNENNTELFINNKKKIFKKKYKFNKIGNYSIKFIFNKNIINSSLENMFYGCENITYINFNIFNTSNVYKINNMFYNCYNLRDIDLSSFNTSKVYDMNNMFYNCYNLKDIDLSSFNNSNIVLEYKKNLLSIKNKEINKLNKLLIDKNKKIDELIKNNHKEILKKEMNDIDLNINKCILLEKDIKLNMNDNIQFLNNEDNNNNSFYDIIININSFKNFNKEGCIIEYGPRGREYYNYNKNIPTLVAGAIGNKNTGKSFLLEKISDLEIPQGFNIKTKGLSIKYGEYNDNNLVIIDSAGLDSPLLKKENNNFNEVKDDDYFFNKNEDDEIHDKLLIDSFIQNFIIYKSDILLFVVENITYYEQLFLLKIKNEVKYKKIFVVHNLKKFTLKEQINDYINNTLKKLYNTNVIEKKFIIFCGEKECLIKYFIEINEKVIHLILVNDYCDISYYYNLSTILFIKNEMKNLKLKNFPVVEECSKFLYKFCQEIYQEKNIKDNFTYTKVNKNHDKINLNEIKILSFCYFDIENLGYLFEEKYIPNYSYYIKKNFLNIFIELPGGGKELNKKIEFYQEYYLFIFEGIKYGDFEIKKDREKNNSDLNVIKNQRLNQNFKLVIKIPNNFKLISFFPDYTSFDKGIVEYKYKIHYDDFNLKLNEFY